MFKSVAQLKKRFGSQKESFLGIRQHWNVITALVLDESEYSDEQSDGIAHKRDLFRTQLANHFAATSNNATRKRATQKRLSHQPRQSASPRVPLLISNRQARKHCHSTLKRPATFSA